MSNQSNDQQTPGLPMTPQQPLLTLIDHPIDGEILLIKPSEELGKFPKSIIKEKNDSNRGSMLLLEKFPERERKSKFQVFPLTSNSNNGVNSPMNGNDQKDSFMSPVPIFNLESPCLNIRPNRQKTVVVTEQVQISQKPLNFLGLLYNLIRIVNVFRFRTKFRSAKYVKDERLKLMNDCCYYPEKKQNKSSLKRFVEKNVFKRMYYYFKYYLTSVKIIEESSDKIHGILQWLNESIPVIKPNQRAKIMWDVLILIIIVFFFFVIPMQISFDIFYDEQFTMLMEEKHVSPTLTHFILMIPEFIMITDTLLKFITGYYEQGIIIMNKGKIIHKYLKKGLIYDILSYCPILMQAFWKDSLFKSDGNFGLILKTLQLLVFCKLKRINTLLRNFEDVIVVNGKHDYLLSLVRISFRIVFVAHLNACVWHAVAYYNSENLQNWLVYAGLEDGRWVDKYWNSMYWAVSAMVTVGFGEKVSPQNNIELAVGVVILLISAYIFGFTLNSMRQIFDLMSKNENEFKETISVINQFMKKKNIEFELQGRVRKYLEYTMDKERNSDKEVEILNKLTASLRNEVLLQSHGNILTKIPLFTKNFSAQTVQTLSFCMKKLKFSPEEYVYRSNELDNCSLFIIEKGEVEEVLTNENMKGKSVINLYKRGDPFGVRSFFTSEKREVSAISKNFSTIFEIKKADFMEVLEKEKKDYEKFCMIKQEMQLNSFSEDLNIRCEACHNNNHFISYCPLLHYIPDRRFILAKIIHTRDQMREPKTRKQTRNKNALKHLNSIKENAKSYELSSSSSESESDEEEYETQNEKDEDFKRRSTQEEDVKKAVTIEGESLMMNMKLEPIKESDEQEGDKKSVDLENSAIIKIPNQKSNQLAIEESSSNTLNPTSLYIPNMDSPIKKNSFSFAMPRKSKRSIRASIFNSDAFSDPQRENSSSQSGTPSPMRKSIHWKNEFEYQNQNYMRKSIWTPDMQNPISPAKSNSIMMNKDPSIFNFNNMDNSMLIKTTNVARASSHTFPTGIITQKMSVSGVVDKITPEELFFFDMDTLCSYNIYYPHNNIENVIKSLIKNRRKSRRKTMKMHAKN